MNPNMSEWLNLIFRWIHVVAGIAWIGHLYFFNFVNAQIVKTYDADSKKKVVPELMPRALYWFRWGAAYTGFSGLMLLGLVYYMGGVMDPAEGMSNGAVSAVGFISLFVGFWIYDFLWKSPLGKNEMAAAAVSYVLLVGVIFGFTRIMGPRAMFIHVGSMIGMLMLINVWMRIWPSQKKIIAGIKGTGPAPDPSVPALAGLRSKHNTYLSVPLVFTMISNHFPTVFGHDYNWIILAALILVGWGATKLLYNKAASAAPSQIGDAAAPAAAPAPKP